MNLGAEALVFAHYPLLILGGPIGVLLMIVLHRARSDKNTVVWWLMAAYSIDMIVRSVENIFYAMVRLLPHYQFLRASPEFIDVLSGFIKYGYGISMMLAFAAVYNFYEPNHEHRTELYLKFVLIYSLLSLVLYGIMR